MRRFEDIQDAEKVFNAGHTRAATWYVSREHDDIFDSDTVYDIELWDAARGRLLALYTRTYTVGAGGERGKPVSGVSFDAEDRLWIEFSDGSREPAEPPRLRRKT